MNLVSVALVVALVSIPVRSFGDELPTVPIALVDAPPSFEDARFVTALETYVTNARLSIVRLSAMTDDAVCAALIESTRAAPSPVVLWARWTHGTMSLSMVTVEHACGAVETSTVDVPPDQPAFIYRVAALKLASFLRVVPAAAPRPEAPMPAKLEPVRKPLPAVVTSAPEHAVELGAAGVASTESAARTYTLVASGWIGTRYSLGGTLLASVAHEANAPGGSGRARLFGALVGARRTFAHSGRFALVGEIDLGVVSVWSSAQRITTTATDAMSERVWTPLAAFAPHLRILLAGPLHVTVGPTLEIASRAVLLTLGDTPLYHASLVRFRWDVRAQIWF